MNSHSLQKSSINIARPPKRNNSLTVDKMIQLVMQRSLELLIPKACRHVCI